MNPLRRLFRMSTDETSTTTDIPLVDSRGRLHAAVAVRQRYERELSAAQEAVERVNSIIADAENADRAATTAEKQAAEAAKAWALRGALDDDTDEAALNVAVEARQYAQRLALKGQGASAALPTLRHAEDAARMALDSARSAVKEAITAILLDESEDLFTELDRLREQYMDLLTQGAALSTLLSPRWGAAHAYRTALAADMTIGERIAALCPKIPADHDPRVRQHIEALSQYARALLGDPNATSNN
jgi:hypothetical protein